MGFCILTINQRVTGLSLVARVYARHETQHETTVSITVYPLIETPRGGAFNPSNNKDQDLVLITEWIFSPYP